MTPKEKAKELYHKFLTCQPDMHLAKQSTLFCVDEILNNSCMLINPILDHSMIIEEDYWRKVKTEIEKL